jgi:RES domain.
MPFAVASNLQPFRGDIWRAVEAQHKVSTMRLVDNDLADQTLLENILESAKPPLPEAARSLHWLLATPFRYRPWPPGSRFRAPEDTGVYYGALERRTACAEVGFWRWRFVQDSDGLKTLEAHPMSLFAALIDTRAIDLRQPPFDAQRAAWTHPADYSATQAFAREARDQEAGAILYESVRDPEHGGCAAVLAPEAFEPGQSPVPETWYLTVTGRGASWQRERGEYFAFEWR